MRSHCSAALNLPAFETHVRPMLRYMTDPKSPRALKTICTSNILYLETSHRNFPNMANWQLNSCA
jgi:hypothetical protein